MVIIAGAPCFLVLGIVIFKAEVKAAPLESQHLKPLQEQQQSSYENQQASSYQSHTFEGTSFCSKSQQPLAPKSYATHAFLGIKNAWIGKKVFSDRAPSAWRGSQKQLEKKVFTTHSYSNSSETVTGRAFETCSYPTKTFYLEAKAQGGLDDGFQKALQQKKSPAAVQEMLEKEF